MSLCSQCGAGFSCGMVDARDGLQCWCTALPTAANRQVLRDADGQPKSCLCADCLTALRARRLLEKEENQKEAQASAEDRPGV